MDTHPEQAPPTLAARRATVISHLDGTLDEQMLDAMQGVWSMLEHAAADAPAHARAVRARLFWESLTPGGVAAAPSAVVTDLMPAWDEGEDSAVDEDDTSEWVDADAA